MTVIRPVAAEAVVAIALGDAVIGAQPVAILPAPGADVAVHPRDQAVLRYDRHPGIEDAVDIATGAEITAAVAASTSAFSV